MLLETNERFRPISASLDWNRISRKRVSYVQILATSNEQRDTHAAALPLNVRVQLIRPIVRHDEARHFKSFHRLMPMISAVGRELLPLDKTHFKTIISARDGRLEKFPEFLPIAAEYFNHEHRTVLTSPNDLPAPASALYFIAGATVRFQGALDYSSMQVVLRYDSASALPTDLTLMPRDTKGQFTKHGTPTVLMVTEANAEQPNPRGLPQYYLPPAVQTESEWYLLVKISLTGIDGAGILRDHAAVRVAPNSVFKFLSQTDLADQWKAACLLNEMAKLQHGHVADGGGRFTRVDLVQHLIGQLLGARDTTAEPDNRASQGKFLFKYKDARVNAQVNTLVYVNGPSAVALNVADGEYGELSSSFGEECTALPHLETFRTEANLKMHLKDMGVQQLAVFNVDFRSDMMQISDDRMPWNAYHHAYVSSTGDGLPCSLTFVPSTFQLTRINQGNRYSGKLVQLGNDVPPLETISAFELFPFRHILEHLVNVMDKARVPVISTQQAANLFKSYVSTYFRTVNPLDASNGKNVLGVTFNFGDNHAKYMWHVTEFFRQRGSESGSNSGFGKGNLNVVRMNFEKNYKRHVEKYNLKTDSATVRRASTVHISRENGRTVKRFGSCSDSASVIEL